jgi:CheY-like chemotaxis protein
MRWEWREADLSVKILIVDDSEFILQLLQTIFLTEGFETRVARDGAWAVSQSLAEPPDVILLDIRMPGMDGWQVLERLRADERTRQIPVVMTSTDDQANGSALALVRGAQAYVMKPFSPSALVWTVRDAVSFGPRPRASTTHLSIKRGRQLDI